VFKWISMLALIAGLSVVAACSDGGEEVDTPRGDTPAPKTDKSILGEMPEVDEAHRVTPDTLLESSPKEGDVYVMRGRISDVVSGFHQMKVVGKGNLVFCGEGDNSDDHCSTPWDYCCMDPDELKSLTVTVKFLDEAGEHPMKAKGKRGYRHLDIVDVSGTFTKGPAGDWVLNATSLKQVERPEEGSHWKWPDTVSADVSAK